MSVTFSPSTEIFRASTLSVASTETPRDLASSSSQPRTASRAQLPPPVLSSWADRSGSIEPGPRLTVLRITVQERPTQEDPTMAQEEPTEEAMIRARATLRDLASLTAAAEEDQAEGDPEEEVTATRMVTMPRRERDTAGEEAKLQEAQEVLEAAEEVTRSLARKSNKARSFLPGTSTTEPRKMRFGTSSTPRAELSMSESPETLLDR